MENYLRVDIRYLVVFCGKVINSEWKKKFYHVEENRQEKCLAGVRIIAKEVYNDNHELLMVWVVVRYTSGEQMVISLQIKIKLILNDESWNKHCIEV